MSFASKQNVEFLSDILLHFFRDKYQANVPLPEIQSTVADYIQKLDPAIRGKMSLEDINKRIVSNVKEILKMRLRASSGSQSAAPETHGTEQDDDSGESFMNKLQQLEIQRSAIVAPEPVGGASVAGSVGSGGTMGGGLGGAGTPAGTHRSNSSSSLDVASLKSVADVLVGKVSSAVNTGGLSATVFLQPPTKRSKEFVIRSWDRPWYTDGDSRNRNGVVVQNVPFIRDTTTQVLYAFLPRDVCSMTPFVVLQIRGATGSVFQSYLFATCPNNGSCSNHWIAFRPGSDSLGYITPLALPWTVSFLASDGSPLEMGEDGQILEYDGAAGMHRVRHLQELRELRELGTTDVVWVSVRNELRKSRVRAVEAGTPGGFAGFVRLEGVQETCKLLNCGKQWNIIFEISTTKNKS